MHATYFIEFYVSRIITYVVSYFESCILSHVLSHVMSHIMSLNIIKCVTQYCGCIASKVVTYIRNIYFQV